YEIHHGRTERLGGATAAFDVLARNGDPAQDVDGCIGGGGSIMATMMHGVLRSPALRHGLFASLGFTPRPTESAPNPYDALADAFEREVRVDLIEAILGASP